MTFIQNLPQLTVVIYSIARYQYQVSAKCIDRCSLYQPEVFNIMVSSYCQDRIRLDMLQVL
jgi:hypothetical protein